METLRSFDPLFSVILTAEITVVDEEHIRLHFEWKDMQGQIVMPQSPEAGRHHELWKQTCFEAFIRPKVGIGYFEVNLSTTGAWNIYHFNSYRQPQPPQESAIATVTELSSTRESLDATIHLPDTDLTLLDANLCAVLILKNGTSTYWSTKNAPHKPDFHHPDCLTLERKSP